MNIKVCGLTRPEDAALAGALGAWALGAIFHPSSPRYLEPQQLPRLREAVQAVRPHSPKWVGVFVNASFETLVETQQQAGFDLFQLHGNEPPHLCQRLRQATGCAVIKALHLHHEDDLYTVAAYADAAQGLLVDAAVPGQWGGTGQLADWALAKRAQAYGPLILAGGIHPGNVRAAWDTVQPDALDLASGVESSPGIKDPDKLRALFAAAHPPAGPDRIPH
jgi:phosphoribosylanthranilate isomerase